MDHEFENRLAREKSPYLLQHAHNPVDWYPWGDEALERAVREDKPLFVSIGYSTCHWCHVMERESFEDEAIAKRLNEQFVCIKVDREERPDVDEIYMAAVQAMTGQGGWPLNVFLTPDRRPFYGGTYWPPQPRFGRPGFGQVVEAMARAWSVEREKVLAQAAQLTDAVRQLSRVETGDGVPGPELVEAATADLARAFDARFGGWGSAPKFPRVDFGRLALRHAFRTGEATSLDMVTRTLDAMARGGIFDHLGGGFARYSTDDRWLVPHFEKMLYDNAQLALHYTEAFQFTHDELYERTARATIDYVLRDLTHADGGFFSAEDADSEGVEGKFYVWSLDEIESVLDADEAMLFVEAYGVTADGNFDGANVLERVVDDATLAQRHECGVEEIRERLDAARRELFLRRTERVRPGLDDKVLTGWNGLMIAACARAAVVFGEPRYLEAARRAADFVESRLRHPDGGLLRRWRDGDARIDALAEDHAYYCAGLLELAQATLDPDWLDRAREVHTALFDRFADRDGTLFSAAPDAHDLVVRVKVASDGSTPSPNSVAASNALTLFAMTGDGAYREQAERLLTAFAPTLRRAPLALASMVTAVDALGAAPVSVVVAHDDPALAWPFACAARRAFHPDLHLVGARSDGATDTPLARGKTAPSSGALAYLCRDFACQEPTADPEQLAARSGARVAHTADPSQ